MYPPAGNPYQGPQGNQPPPQGYPQYPPQGYPQAPAMPPPPWQVQSAYGAPHQQHQPRPSQGRKGMYVVVGMVVLTMMLVMGSIGFFTDEDGRYFSNGDTLTPTADEYLIFTKDEDLAAHNNNNSISCTGTTDSGERLTLSAPPEPVTVTRGHKSSTRRYTSAAELPTDRGALTVNCALGNDKPYQYLMLLAKPESSQGLLWLFGGYGLLMAILVGAVIIVRRRYFRRYPQPGSGYSA